MYREREGDIIMFLLMYMVGDIEEHQATNIA
jgi:hypothetical protein